MWRPTNNGKHKKLSEEVLNHNAENKRKSGKKDTLQEDFGCDGYDEDEIVSFQVKYLGSTVVEKLNGGDNISEHAVQCILSNLKAQKAQKGQKTPKISKSPQILQDADQKKKRTKKSSRSVELTISPKGLCVMQADQGVDLLKISIYRISNCRTHQQRIVSFLATDALETTECHAFLCKRRKNAEDVALAMAKAFHAAYEQWTSVAPLRLHEIRSSLPPPVPTKTEQIVENNMHNRITEFLITFDDGDQLHQDEVFSLSDDKENESQSFGGNAWVSFEDSQSVDLLC